MILAILSLVWAKMRRGRYGLTSVDDDVEADNDETDGSGIYRDRGCTGRAVKRRKAPHLRGLRHANLGHDGELNGLKDDASGVSGVPPFMPSRSCDHSTSPAVGGIGEEDADGQPVELEAGYAHQSEPLDISTLAGTPLGAKEKMKIAARGMEPRSQVLIEMAEQESLGVESGGWVGRVVEDADDVGSNDTWEQELSAQPGGRAEQNRPTLLSKRCDLD